MLLIVKTCAVLFSLSQFSQHWVKGEGDLKSLPLIFAFAFKVFLVVSPYFFDWLCENYGEKNVQTSRAVIYFSKPVKKTNIVRS